MIETHEFNEGDKVQLSAGTSWCGSWGRDDKVGRFVGCQPDGRGVVYTDQNNLRVSNLAFLSLVVEKTYAKALAERVNAGELSMESAIIQAQKDAT